jgi:hypothetical protein
VARLPLVLGPNSAVPILRQQLPTDVCGFKLRSILGTGLTLACRRLKWLDEQGLSSLLLVVVWWCRVIQ